MSMGSQVKVFCKDVAKSKTLWTIQFDDGSYIKWCNDDGSEIFPIWSTESRVKRILDYADELGGGRPIAILFEVFLTEWLPNFTKAGVKLGPNWVGKNLSGTSFEAIELVERVKQNEDI